VLAAADYNFSLCCANRQASCVPSLPHPPRSARFLSPAERPPARVLPGRPF
jgi:hypothetical protein